MENRVYLEFHSNNSRVKKGHIRFKGKVSEDTIDNLEEAIASAFNYYFYNEIEIRITSPGGEGNCMYHIANLFNKYKKKGKIIGVTALMKAYSAGAFLLTNGTIGKRAAYQDATLLYHYGRVLTEKSEITKHKAEFLHDALNKEDKIFLDNLTDNAIKTLKSFPQEKIESAINNFISEAKNLNLISKRKFNNINIQNINENKLKNIISFIYDNLLNANIVITPEQAVNLLLIDKIIYE